MRILIFLAVALITGCKQDFGGFYRFKWAEVDTARIESVVEEQFRQQNPAPEDVQSGRRNRISEELDNLSTQVSRLEKEASRKCADASLQEIIAQGKQVMCSSPVYPGCEQLYDQKCLATVDKDPFVVDMRAKRDALEEKRNISLYYKMALRKLVTKNSADAIKKYAEGKFDLVVRKSDDEILYEKKGLRMDITEAVINELRVNPQDLKMTDQQIRAVGQDHN